jgi:hypothetical protein
MHGKPKRTEHRIIKPTTGLSELVSYKQYNYFTSGGKLSNEVPVVAYDPVTHKMKQQMKTLGIEADITVDTREKTEETKSKTIYANLNTSLAGILPIPLPFGFYYWFNFKNEFRSVVATKVIQQYGILKEVQSSEEGALTTIRNEAFDPVSGQALITSVNNEYNDKEYSVNYPAYWGYKSMGPSYQNTGYEEDFASVPIVDHAAVIPVNSMANYRVGDEVYMTYSGSGGVNAWVTSMYIESIPPLVTPFKCTAPWCLGLNATNLHIIDTIDLSNMNAVHLSIFVPDECHEESDYRNECGNKRLILKPRYKSTFPQSGTLSNVHLKIVRSGAKNQLNESIQSYTSMSSPFDVSGNLKDNLDKLINISAREYSDTLTAILPQFDSLTNPTSWDTMNIYVNGTRQIKRVSKEYAYIKNRNYNGASQRNAGLFEAKGLWQMGSYTDGCVFNGYKYCAIDTVIIPNGTPVNNGSYGNGFGMYDDLTQNQLYVLKMPVITPPNYSMEYNYLVPKPTDDKNWVVARTVTKYSPWGFELENKDAIGNYTAAMYGYNQQLPVALAQNAQQHEVYFDGFEEYSLLQVKENKVHFSSSLMEVYNFLTTLGNSSQYRGYGTSFDQGAAMPVGQAHTGKFCLKTGGSNYTLNLSTSANPVSPGQPRYKHFTMQNGEKYIVSYWIKPVGTNSTISNYSAPGGMQAKSRIIDRWQQMEGVITVPGNATSYDLVLPASSYIDDIRIYPFLANMKSFVYHPVNQKLVATLDENNYASFYEYDQEGNLIRTKKETDKGIITVMESRSANVSAK